MGSSEGGLHEGVPDQWRTHEYGNLRVCNNLFFSFLLVFLNFPDPFHQKLFPWEHRNIAGSPPLHNYLGNFCCGRSLKIKREVFTFQHMVTRSCCTQSRASPKSSLHLAVTLCTLILVMPSRPRATSSLMNLEITRTDGSLICRICSFSKKKKKPNLTVLRF